MYRKTAGPCFAGRIQGSEGMVVRMKAGGSSVGRIEKTETERVEDQSEGKIGDIPVGHWLSRDLMP